MPEYRERAPGTYRANFVKLDEHYKIMDRESGEEVERWRWLFQEVDDQTTVGELDTLTTPGFKSRSNGLKFFTGMLGRAPREGDNTDSLIGQTFDVSYGPNQNGRYTIVGVTRPVQKRTASSEAQEVSTTFASAQHAAQEGDVVEFRGAKVEVTDPDAKTDELPF